MTDSETRGMVSAARGLVDVCVSYVHTHVRGAKRRLLMLGPSMYTCALGLTGCDSSVVLWFVLLLLLMLISGQKKETILNVFFHHCELKSS